MNLNSNSAEETFRIGEQIGNVLNGDELVLIYGDLGAGKTVLTKGIGSALGIAQSEIVSPTFTLMNIYSGEKKLYHLDLYRIGEKVKGPVPEIDDNLDRGIIVVEWAQYLDPLYLNENKLIEIELLFPSAEIESREIVLKTNYPKISINNFKV